MKKEKCHRCETRLSKDIGRKVRGQVTHSFHTASWRNTMKIYQINPKMDQFRIKEACWSSSLARNHPLRRKENDVWTSPYWTLSFPFCWSISSLNWTSMTTTTEIFIESNGKWFFLSWGIHVLFSSSEHHQIQSQYPFLCTYLLSKYTDFSIVNNLLFVDEKNLNQPETGTYSCYHHRVWEECPLSWDFFLQILLPLSIILEAFQLLTFHKLQPGAILKLHLSEGAKLYK